MLSPKVKIFKEIFESRKNLASLRFKICAQREEQCYDAQRNKTAIKDDTPLLYEQGAFFRCLRYSPAQRDVISCHICRNYQFSAARIVSRLLRTVRSGAHAGGRGGRPELQYGVYPAEKQATVTVPATKTKRKGGELIGRDKNQE